MQATDKIAQRLETIQQQVTEAALRSGRSPEDVRIVIVTKAAPLEAVKEVIKLGYRDLGENRFQHLKTVAEQIETWQQQQENEKLREPVRWHMIGHLQRNKVKPLLKISRIIHSVDTLRLAEEIDNCSAKSKYPPDVLLQVNCSQEPQKYGVPVGAAIHVAEQICSMPNIRLRGIMTMAPLTRNKQEVVMSFARAKEIFEDIRKSYATGPEFNHLSMGMSQDYQIAVEHGATILRIGSAIFS